MNDFADVARSLNNSGAAKEVKNSDELCASLLSILGNRELSNVMGKKAAIVIEEKAGAAKRHAEIILKYSRN